MLITSRGIRFGLLGLLLASSSSWAAAIQGDVKGPDGKGIKGADVRMERKDKKTAPVAVKTDQRGHYAFMNLDLGTYALRVSANGMAATSSDNVKARSDGAVRVDFNLKNQAGNVATSAKKKTHKVWMPPEIGTNLGGRWVEVGDDGSGPETSSTPGVNNSSKANGTAIRSFQQNASGGSHGGN